MTLSRVTPIDVERLLAGFFAQGTNPVYVAVCCSKLYVGDEPAKACTTCNKVNPPGVIVPNGMSPQEVIDALHIIQGAV